MFLLKQPLRFFQESVTKVARNLEGLVALNLFQKFEFRGWWRVVVIPCIIQYKSLLYEPNSYIAFCYQPLSNQAKFCRYSVIARYHTASQAVSLPPPVQLLTSWHSRSENLQSYGQMHVIASLPS